MNVRVGLIIAGTDRISELDMGLSLSGSEFESCSVVCSSIDARLLSVSDLLVSSNEVFNRVVAPEE